MRLIPEEINAIRQLAHRYFGVAARIWLFGSRVDDERRGGDIDLFIETDINAPEKIVQSELTFLADLKEKIGEQKIDLLIDFPGRKYRPEIFKIAKESGVRI